MKRPEQSAHKLVALLQKVATELPIGEGIYWIGCPTIPEQVLNAIKQGIKVIDPTWTAPPTTEPMEAIKKSIEISERIFLTAQKTRNEEAVTVEEFRSVIDRL